MLYIYFIQTALDLTKFWNVVLSCHDSYVYYAVYIDDTIHYDYDVLLSLFP